MEISKGKIITLEGYKKYILNDETFFEDNKYYLAMGIENDEKQVKDEIVVFKEIKNNDEFFLEPILDTRLVFELMKIFQKE